MSSVLIIGCGDLGTAIATRLYQAQHNVFGVRQSNQLLPLGMQTIQADITQPSTLLALDNLKPNIIIYCVAAKTQTDESYQAHYVTGLKNVLATQAQNKALQHVFFISSTRVYGQVTHHLLDETVPAAPSDFGGERLLEAEHVLKMLQFEPHLCKSTSMRLSGIYGNGRLYLANMAKDVTKWPQANNWSNRIHRDDAADFIAFLVDKAFKNQSIADCYIVTDDMPTLQYDVLTWLAHQQKIDTSGIQIPTIQGGKRLSNQRLRATGFQLRYPNYQAGYTKVLNSKIPDTQNE